MTLIAVTGASGFIGQETCACFRAAGHDVLELVRDENARSPGVSWRLGEPLPLECHSVDAIVHLASAAIGERHSLDSAVRLDVDGTRVLRDEVRRLRAGGRRIKIVFLSSQSARATAANAYGQSKWAVEGLMDQDDEIVIRPGLVYSEVPASVFALFEKLARLPIVPIINDFACIQPIHVRELAASIVQLTTMDRPPRLMQLGSIMPLTFREALGATAYRTGRRAPMMMTIPQGPVRLTARILDRVLGLTLTERLDGLCRLQPMDTEASLQTLGRTLAPFRIRQSTAL